jgi:hypothetical protein
MGHDQSRWMNGTNCDNLLITPDNPAQYNILQTFSKLKLSAEYLTVSHLLFMEKACTIGIEGRSGV